jgi:hypothetical protein
MFSGVIDDGQVGARGTRASVSLRLPDRTIERRVAVAGKT